MSHQMFDAFAGMLFGTMLGLSLIGFALVLVKIFHSAQTP
jgi:hypothetical protein